MGTGQVAVGLLKQVQEASCLVLLLVPVPGDCGPFHLFRAPPTPDMLPTSTAEEISVGQGKQRALLG